jgi:hypothetical protein
MRPVAMPDPPSLYSVDRSDAGIKANFTPLPQPRFPENATNSSHLQTAGNCR